MRTAAAGGTIAACWRFNEFLMRRQLLHLVEDTAVGGHDETGVVHLLRRLQQLGGGTNRIRHLDDRGR